MKTSQTISLLNIHTFEDDLFLFCNLRMVPMTLKYFCTNYRDILPICRVEQRQLVLSPYFRHFA